MSDMHAFVVHINVTLTELENSSFLTVVETGNFVSDVYLNMTRTHCYISRKICVQTSNQKSNQIRKNQLIHLTFSSTSNISFVRLNQYLDINA